MREFSIGDAITAGVRLVAREPLAFLAWALVYGLVGLTPQFVGMAMGFDAMSTLRSGAAADPEALTQAMAPMQALQPVSFVASVVSGLLLYGAAYRAVLFPEDRRFLFLRLGGRELWMALTVVAVFLIAFAAILVVVLLIVGITAAGSAAAGASGALIAFPLILLLVGIMMWGASRLALAPPMAFAERNFRIPEAWRQTRGHAGRIFLVMLGVFGLLLLAQVLLFALGAGIFSLFMPLSEMGRLLMQNPAGLFAKIHPVGWALAAVLWALFGTWSMAMFAASLAEIYRGLRGPDHAEVFS
ncbi:hypothetical protein [uncultured Phenylobacterium sp.]|uniref:hypothetical protein n=1 Tax=uncultured Phenylobacterium sp. TaxID=349273 RepID=UPI00260143BD|nr:hypothetical protein [uncultured Phenylobacterium sp.]